MKKFTFAVLVIVAMALVGCGGNTKATSADNVDSIAVDTAVTDTVVADSVVVADSIVAE